MIAEYKPIYRVSEAAKILCTDRSSVYRMINSGQLPYVKINNAKKIRGSDLEKFIENLEIHNCTESKK